MSSSRRRSSAANIWAAKPAKQTQSTPRTTPKHCKPYILLHRDIRPSTASQTKYNVRRSDICSHSCIYCDIWKLGLLVSSRAPTSPDGFSTPTTTTTTTNPRPFSLHFSPSQPTAPPRATASSEAEYQIQLKAFDSAYFSERMRFKAILSICTANGASESEGLRAAHDRCLATVLDLLRRERALEKRMVLVREREADREREAVFGNWAWPSQQGAASPVCKSRRGSRQWDAGRWDAMSGSAGSVQICAA